MTSRRRHKQLERMTVLCEFYSMSPLDYRALTLEEVCALVDHRNKVIKAQNKAARRQRGH